MAIESRLRILESRVAQLEEKIRDLEKRQEQYPTDLTNITLPKASNLDFPVSGS